MTKLEFDRLPVVITFAEHLRMMETYGFAGSQGQTVLEDRCREQLEVVGHDVVAARRGSARPRRALQPEGRAR